MKRKVLALMLIAMLTLTIVPACAEPDEQVPEQATTVAQDISDPVTPAEETPEAEPEKSPEPADSDAVDVPNEPEAEATPEVTTAPETPVEPEPVVTDTPVVTDAPAPEVTEDPVLPEETAPAAPEVTDEPAPEETAEPFAAKVRIALRNSGEPCYYGDEVTLWAVVTEANAAYTVVWQYYNEAARVDLGENPWVDCGDGMELRFIANEVNTARTYRVVLNGAVISGEYRMPEVTARPEEPDEAVEPETEEPLAPEVTEDAAPEAEEPAAEEAPEFDAESLLAPDRSIAIHAVWEGEQLHFGDETTLIAELSGYDNATYTVQWQTSKDGLAWTDVEGATELSHTMIVSEENYQDRWRLIVTVTAVLPD